MAVERSGGVGSGDRMIQGRIWTQRVPRKEIAPEAAEARFQWWSRVYPALFNPRRYVGEAIPAEVGKGCVACLMDTRETDLQRCPRCRRSLIWVRFEHLPY
jgi:hypothetical protein